VLIGAGSVVTPGSVDVEASAPGRVSFHRAVPVAPGATATVDIDLPTVGSTPPHAPTAVAPEQPPRVPQRTTTATPTPTPAPTPAVATPSPTPSPGFLTPMRGAGIGVAAAGLVALGIGSWLFVDTTNAYNHCVMVTCPASERAVGENWAAVSLLYGGGALVIAGAALILLGRPHAAEQPRVGVWMSPGGVAGVVGRF
jgi:hypothetical protein